MNQAKDNVRKQYGSVGDAYVRSQGHATGSDLDRMVELANPDGSERLLDIATGGGHVARVFSPHVREIVASDLTPEILRHASAAFEEWGCGNVTTAEADAEDLPFDDASFDMVTCRIAPHHFPNPQAFVAEVARVLKPAGQFILIDSTVPEGEDGAFFNSIEKLRDPSHVRSLTIDEWSGLIQAAGFDLNHIQSFRKRHDFADWVTRSRTSDFDRDELGRMFATSTPSQREAFEIETNESDIVGFTDTKTLFHAIRQP